ncbi:12325_t:CDS:2 [Cetraspora pellucida]|uniref:12325_t:CDS:1 n=1 Tax=Cetraspora pellucida TaxID=1433469 RepID=A0ACA9M922_9GLOM|nr:12325_t:CDS:2 [Cetraspora pellucida]
MYQAANPKRGSHYPTLDMMYLIIQKLFQHLDTVYNKLATFKVKEVCIAVNQSMSKHWDKPKEARLIASYLDPRFKNLCFLNIKERTKTISLLCTQIIELSNSHTCITTSSLTKNTQEHMMSKFFDDSDTVAQLLLDTELQLYNSLLLVSKYDLDHPEYKKDNLLLFWCKYAKSLQLLAS